MKQLFIKLLKEFSGGQQPMTTRQRLIYVWWSVSLTMTILCAENLLICFLWVLSFGWASQYLKEVPIPEDEEDEDDYKLDEEIND
jgi:hypothetical protein